MKTRSFIRPLAAAALALLTFAAGRVLADSITIISPDTAQTTSYYRASAKRLHWDPKKQVLYADITFSNEQYASRTEPPRTEYFLFRLPGIRLDPATRGFNARNSDGQTVPVAALKKGLIGQYVELLSGTRVFIIVRSGAVRVVLTANTSLQLPGPGSQWVQTDNDYLLKSSAAR
jgi:Ni/Co efflux regulator RcnB